MVNAISQTINPLRLAIETSSLCVMCYKFIFMQIIMAKPTTDQLHIDTYLEVNCTVCDRNKMQYFPFIFGWEVKSFG